MFPFPTLISADIINHIVAIAGFCMLTSLIDEKWALLPVLVALAFPGYPVEAAAIVMVVVFFVGVFVKLLHGMKR